MAKKRSTAAGLRVTTSLDLDLQAKGQAALEHWISQFEDTRPRTQRCNGGNRPKDVGGAGLHRLARLFPGRHPGPQRQRQLVELSGFDTQAVHVHGGLREARLGPGHADPRHADELRDGDKVFTPSNPSHDFHGNIPVKVALGNSLNIPAFKTARLVGVPDVVSEYKKFGMTTLDGHTYGPSVTLGGVDINLYDVTYGYSVFAANGVMRGVPTTKSLDAGNRKLDPVKILQITRQDGKVLYPDTEDHRVKVQEERVVDGAYAYQIQSILSDGNNFCLTYGCGALSIGRTWGVKTGTSEPYENSKAIGETWTYGFTPDLVTGVWAGNSDNTPMFNITSTSISYRAVRDFMQEALVDTPASNFVRPDNMVDADVCEPSGLKPTGSCGLVVKNLLPRTRRRRRTTTGGRR